MVAIVSAIVAAPLISAYQQNKAAKDAKSVQEQQVADAAKLAAEQERELNKVNRKKPNIASLLMSNTPQSSTMLTGSTGVDPSKLKLSKTTLLGG